MNCLFIGKHFAFPRYCHDLDDIVATVKRCMKSYKCREHIISRKIQSIIVDLADGQKTIKVTDKCPIRLNDK